MGTGCFTELLNHRIINPKLIEHCMLTYWDQNKIKKRKLRKLITFRPALQKKKSHNLMNLSFLRKKFKMITIHGTPKFYIKMKKLFGSYELL